MALASECYDVTILPTFSRLYLLPDVGNIYNYFFLTPILTGSCKENVEGRTCDHCVAGNWQFPDCKPCECDLRGTTVEVCNQVRSVAI